VSKIEHDERIWTAEEGRTLTMDKVLLSPEEVADALSLSRSKVYELLASGRLHSIKIGRCRRIVRSVLLQFVDELQQRP
jgi:excisionase family DNA binding protein